MALARRLDELDNELARAVFRALYASRTQRLQRLAAALLLTGKHTLRGMLFSWPLYLMAIAGFFAPPTIGTFLWMLAVPGIGISFYILGKGIRDDYREQVAERVFAPGDLRRILRGKTP